MDRVVDDYVPVVAGVENDIDEIEDEVFGVGERADVSRRIYELTREVIAFQRATKPLVAMLERLMDAPAVDDEERRYLRDVQDHALRVQEQADGFRELLQNILNVNLTLETKALSEVSNRQNEEVKKISAWAAILFAPSIVGTIYGMNFDHMPELRVAATATRSRSGSWWRSAVGALPLVQAQPLDLTASAIAAYRTARHSRRSLVSLRRIDTAYIFSLFMREVFLALLAGDTEHGYELKQTLEHEFGQLLPALNAGQIYSTLARLERDGLIVGQSVAGDSRRKRVYELTESGRAVLAGWIQTPVPGTRLKDEFFMKFVVVASVGLAEPKSMIDVQRREYLQSLRDLDALLAANGKGAAAELLVEGAILHLKADLQWLDLIEQRLTAREEST